MLCVARAYYWITSSAVASSVSGMVRPRALAVLRLIASSNLIGWMTCRSAGFLVVQIADAAVIAHQAAGQGELAV
jgi:hypothetical protein